MIGQDINKEIIDNFIINNRFPKFFVIKGITGSGKKTLAKYIADKLNCEIIIYDYKVDSIRELINTCYTQTTPILYLITDGENLSAQAENAILKISEEPPKNAYIGITVSDDSLLNTINSRAFSFWMNPYSLEDKCRYINKKHLDVDKYILDISNNLGDIEYYSNIDYEAVLKYVNSVVSNISKANIGSVLSIPRKIKLKDSDADKKDMYDLKAFMDILKYTYYQKFLTSDNKKYYNECYNIIFESSKQLNRNLSKQIILDDMMLKLRSVKL